MSVIVCVVFGEFKDSLLWLIVVCYVYFIVVVVNLFCLN